MSSSITTSPSSVWTSYEKIIFRVFFIYFFIQAVPLDWKYYQQLFSINWSQLHYGDIFNLAHYMPQFFSGAQTYANWAIAFGIALPGAAIWTYAERNRERDYNYLYYLIRSIVRYRLAIAIIAYGFLKFFPLQAPYPSISNLNTDYGDFNRWKLFSLSLGIVPGYELFLGAVEIVFGLLLLYRKTASISAFLILIFAGNVFVSNIAYDGGEEVYSLYLISFALFILAYDIQRIFNLIILQRPTAPNKYKPSFTVAWQKYARLTLKAGVVLFFVVLYGFKTGANYKTDPYQYPRAKGLEGWSGIYNVSEFKLNDQSVPYSITDPVRWKDVVFEEWNTISIRSNRPVILDSTNVDHAYTDDAHRTYELEGSAGRHYYSYEVLPSTQELVLNNRNKHYKGEMIRLKYLKEGNHITLTGTDQNNDAVYVVLDKINKKYLLEEAAKQGRRRGLKL
jgi:hypothetical protein